MEACSFSSKRAELLNESKKEIPRDTSPHRFYSRIG
jgi:hypothetical protein